MKILTFLFSLIILVFTATCNTGNHSNTEYTGVIQEQGITSYQYGTHVLNTEDNFYALKSEKVDLGKYINKKVILKAERIEGYPVDGGPDYLLVTEVREQ